MTPALRWTFVVAIEALLIVLMLPFGFIFTASLPVHQLQVLVLAVFGGIGWVAVLARPARLPNAVVLAPLPVLGTLALASVASAYPTLSWTATWHVAAYTGIFWLLALQAGHPAGRRNLIGALGIVLLLVLTSFVLAVAMAWQSWLSLGYPLTSLPLRPANSGGLALIPTWFADVMALLVPLLCAAWWRRGARGPAFVLAAVAATAIVLTGTRSVMLLLVGLLVLTVVVSIGRRRGRRVVAGAALASIVIGAGGVAVLVATARSFDEGRFSAYASAVNRFAEFPLLGGGPGTYGARRMSDEIQSLVYLAFPDAHNIVLTSAAETGLVGLIGLVATVTLLAIAILTAWRDAPSERPIIVGSMFGVAVLAGHGMVDVVFGLVGIIVLGIASVAIAATRTSAAEFSNRRHIRPKYAALGAGLVVVALSTATQLRFEATLVDLDQADALLETDPASALAAAQRATSASPDSVPAWWVRMATEDRAGDQAQAIAAIRRTIELEGFGQQWISLAILLEASGDLPAALEAVGRARLGPLDPFVELNAAILLDKLGATIEARAAALRLLDAEPDIERVIPGGPPGLARIFAEIRGDAARDRLAAGSLESAFAVALAGEDRALANELVAALARNDPRAIDEWTTRIDAWFGDASARARMDEASVNTPTQAHLGWSWRVAARACDPADMARWERSLQIGFSYVPTEPNNLGASPDIQNWMLPTYYPSFIWRLDHPQHPYPAGAWTYGLGRPSCGQAHN